MGLNSQNKKYIQVSQHWGAKRGITKNGQTTYVNPVSDEGKSRLISLNDVAKLIEFFQWTEGVHYEFKNTSDASWGTEVYEIDANNNLSLVNSDYDSSD